MKKPMRADLVIPLPTPSAIDGKPASIISQTTFDAHLGGHQHGVPKFEVHLELTLTLDADFLSSSLRVSFIFAKPSSISLPSTSELSRYINPPADGAQSPMGTQAVIAVGGPCRKKS